MNMMLNANRTLLSICFLVTGNYWWLVNDGLENWEVPARRKYTNNLAFSVLIITGIFSLSQDFPIFVIPLAAGPIRCSFFCKDKERFKTFEIIHDQLHRANSMSRSVIMWRDFVILCLILCLNLQVDKSSKFNKSLDKMCSAHFCILVAYWKKITI